ncbi:MAG: hypothetical protein JW834_02200, partial [Candidatus Diapherotrites archaeon]|nr:hypothetical protein [Candidatus Diapherotrites archaeon]
MKVAIGIPVMDNIPLEFFHSYMDLEKPEGTVCITTKHKPLDEARNRIAKAALDSGCTHLFFMDSDMVFPPNALKKLLSLDKPVAGGLYFRTVPPYKPLLLQYKDGGYKTMYEFPDNEVVPVDATGTGCLLIKREVLEKMMEPWFKFTDVSEDFQFCRNARQSGFDIFVDTSVACGHLGKVTI